MNDTFATILKTVAPWIATAVTGPLGGLAVGAACDARWAAAAGEMLDSKWAKQTPKRAARMARQMETGAWQYAPLV